MDNSVKTGDISNTWGTNNNNNSAPMEPTPTAAPQPIMNMLPTQVVATPMPRKQNAAEGMSMTTKIVLALCFVIVLVGAGFFGWRYWKKRGVGKKNNAASVKTNNNKTNVANMTNLNNNLNNFNNNMNNNGVALPRPPA